jgi:hypothetical protein
MKKITLIIALLTSVFVSTQSFAFTADGRYKVLSATSVIDNRGTVNCFSTLAFNHFGAIGEIVRVSITDSSVEFSSEVPNSIQYVSLRNGGPVPSRDQITLTGTFGPSDDVFMAVNHETTATEKITVSISGNQLRYQDERSFSNAKFPNGDCLLEKVD